MCHYHLLAQALVCFATVLANKDGVTESVLLAARDNFAFVSKELSSQDGSAAYFHFFPDHRIDEIRKGDGNV